MKKKKNKALKRLFDWIIGFVVALAFALVIMGIIKMMYEKLTSVQMIIIGLVGVAIAILTGISKPTELPKIILRNFKK